MNVKICGVCDGYLVGFAHWSDEEKCDCVVCADCSKRVRAFIECKSTRLEGHDGVWADCPQCGITGVE